MLLIFTFSSISQADWRSFNGESVIQFGPNCHNGTLLASNLISGFRFVSKDEIKAWIESPLCKQVFDWPQEGDILIIRSSEVINDFTHSMIYVSSEEIFSKRSIEPKDEYNLKPFMADIILYGVKSPKCFSFNHQQPDQSCYRWVEAYRCNTFEAKPDIFIQIEQLLSKKSKTGKWSKVEKKQVKQLMSELENTHYSGWFQKLLIPIKNSYKKQLQFF